MTISNKLCLVSTIILNIKDGMNLDLLITTWDFGNVKLAFVMENRIL